MHKKSSLWITAAALFMCFSSVLAQQDNSSTDTTAADESPDIAADDEGSETGAGGQRLPIPDDAELGLVRRSIVIVDDAQAAASERFGNFMGQVDGFFSRAGTNDDAVSNESWARIRLDGVRANNEDFEVDPSFKLRAVLPRTERKLKLLISTEDDESQDAVDGQQAPAGGNQNASLALRFIRSARANSDINIDVGVRQRDGDVQYFGRLNTRYSLDAGDDWAVNVGNSYYHYSKSGFENRLSFDFRRRFFDRDNLFFRTYTDFFWEKGEKGALIGHTTGLYWQMSRGRSLALEGLASYHTALNPGVTDRFNGHEFRIRWRQNIWRPWFFYEVWPSVAWPSITRYRQANGILVRVEIVIGQKS